jgi:hypothetical protein
MTANPTDDNQQRNRDNCRAHSPHQVRGATGATNLNVDGREVVSPMQLRRAVAEDLPCPLTGLTVTPAEVMAVEGDFPVPAAGNRFYLPMVAKPGSAVHQHTVPAFPWRQYSGLGRRWCHADDEMFTVMTPAGFPGGLNLSARYDGTTVIQVQSMARTNDPIYEFGFASGGASSTRFGRCLTQVAHFGVKEVSLSPIASTLPCSGQSKNVWHNAIIRTTFYTMGAPFRWIASRFKRAA